MQNLFKIIFILGISISAKAEGINDSSVFFKSYTKQFLALTMSNQKNSRGPASVSTDLTDHLKKEFFVKNWNRYSDLSENVRRNVIETFSEEGQLSNLDEMVSYIHDNKEELSMNDRIRAAELRGQYDALIIWN